MLLKILDCQVKISKWLDKLLMTFKWTSDDNSAKIISIAQWIETKASLA